LFEFNFIRLVAATSIIFSHAFLIAEGAVENGLHLVDGFEPGAPSFDPEVLVEERAVQPLDDAIGLWPLDPGGAVLDLFELQEQLVRIRPQNSRPLSDSTNRSLRRASRRWAGRRRSSGARP
jgi:hypothetical protein